MSRVFEEDLERRRKKFLGTIAGSDAKTIEPQEGKTIDPQDMNASDVPLAGIGEEGNHAINGGSLDPQDIKPYQSNAKEYATGRDGQKPPQAKVQGRLKGKLMMKREKDEALADKLEHHGEAQ